VVAGAPAPSTNSDPRAHNRWRQLGYRVLPGDLFSYILHLRPAEWPIMAAHTALGYVLAVGIAGVAWGDQWRAALWGMVLWVVGLNGGTLALNSVFDQDEGDIGYLMAPPKPPGRLLEFSVVLLVAGLMGSLSVPRGFRVAYGICLVLSILYSVPPFRFKAVAGVDWVINMWGFGTLTPYAGFAATGRSLDLVSALVLLAFCPLFAALYPLTQLYQFDEDRRRGDRTLALILGMKRSLDVALIACGAAFALLGAAWMLRRPVWPAPWHQAIGGAALVVAFAAWLRVLVPWLRRHEHMSPDEHQRGMYRGLIAWAVTDLAVVAAFAW
jgi:4-hydroxybenzoate polyprenyltransferase